jgi:hypothetical protein
MSVAGKVAHVDPDLGNERLGRGAPDPRNGIQARDVLLEGGDVRRDALAHRGDRFLEVIQMGQQLAN